MFQRTQLTLVYVPSLIELKNAWTRENLGIFRRLWAWISKPRRCIKMLHERVVAARGKTSNQTTTEFYYQKHCQEISEISLGYLVSWFWLCWEEMFWGWSFTPICFRFFQFPLNFQVSLTVRRWKMKKIFNLFRNPSSNFYLTQIFSNLLPFIIILNFTLSAAFVSYLFFCFGF